MEMFRDVGSKMNEVAEHKSEREMDSGVLVCGLILFI